MKYLRRPDLHNELLCTDPKCLFTSSLKVLQVYSTHTVQIRRDHLPPLGQRLPGRRRLRSLARSTMPGYTRYLVTDNTTVRTTDRGMLAI